MIRHHNKNQVGGGWVYFIIQQIFRHPEKSVQEVKAGTISQEMRLRPWRKAA